MDVGRVQSGRDATDGVGSREMKVSSTIPSLPPPPTRFSHPSPRPLDPSAAMPPRRANGGGIAGPASAMTAYLRVSAVDTVGHPTGRPSNRADRPPSVPFFAVSALAIGARHRRQSWCQLQPEPRACRRCWERWSWSFHGQRRRWAVLASDDRPHGHRRQRRPTRRRRRAAG